VLVYARFCSHFSDSHEGPDSALHFATAVLAAVGTASFDCSGTVSASMRFITLRCWLEFIDISSY
jgi:hypothetical protein